MQETRAPFLGQEHLLEKEMATHFSVLAWEIPWKRNLEFYSTWVHKTVEHSLMTKQEQNFAFPLAQCLGCVSCCIAIYDYNVLPLY